MAGSVMTGPVCIIFFDFYNSSFSGGNARRSPALCLSASTRLVAARRNNSRELKASAPKITPCVIIQEQESLQVGSADLSVFRVS